MRRHIHLSIMNKELILFILIFLVSILLFVIPAFSEQNEYSNKVEVWDGTVASSYRSGSGLDSDPYIISSAQEFAFFLSSLSSNTYEDKYFELSVDLLINDGVFNYGDVIEYYKDDKVLYIKPFTNEIYEDKELTTLYVENLNVFDGLYNFKGHFNGNGKVISGMYVSSSSDSSALFNELSGSFSNVVFDNSFVYGKSQVAGLAISASNLDLSKVAFSGNVIATEKKNIQDTVLIDDMTLVGDINAKSYVVGVNPNYVYTQSSLKGSLRADNITDIEGLINIGETPIGIGEFSISDVFDDVNINVGSDILARNIYLENLKLEYSYDSSVASGVVINANNVNMSEVSNLQSVRSLHESSGFVHNLDGVSNISNSYNRGYIHGVKTAAFINNVVNNDSAVNITKLVNDKLIGGDSSAIFINNAMYSKNINLDNNLNYSDNYFINNINDSVITGNSNYTVSNLINLNVDMSSFVSTSDFTTMTSREFLINNNYNITETGTKWESFNSIPTLISSKRLNTISINTNTNKSFNKYSHISNYYYDNKDVVLNVTDEGLVNNISSIKYYISNSMLSMTELDSVEFLDFTGPVTLSEVGSYIFYVKVATYSGDVVVINSDIIKIDKTKPTGSVSFLENTWDSLRSEVNTIETKESVDYILTGSDDDSGLYGYKYYISDKLLNNDELDAIDNSKWKDTDSTLEINPVGSNIIYVKVLDNSGNYIYINSDKIIYNGYSVGFDSVGRNDLFNELESINVTSKSVVKKNFAYQKENVSSYDTYLRNLVFNKSLPIGTIITLNDNVNNEFFEYEVTEDITSIAFTLFNKVGKPSEYYVDSNYLTNKTISEDFDVYFDFSNATITSSILDIKVELDLLDSKGTIKRDCMNSSNMLINVIANSTSSIDLTSSSTQLNIKYDSSSIYSMNLGLQYVMPEGVYDSSVEDKSVILNLSVYDSTDTKVNKSLLKNFMFIVDGVEYTMNGDGNVLVKLDNSFDLVTKQLIIKTYDGDSFLSEGEYTLRVEAYTSYNNYVGDNYKQVNIPMSVDASYESVNYDCNITINEEARIIEKENLTEKITIESKINNSSASTIKMSLYKKKNFDGVNQEYELIDLQDYTNMELVMLEDKVYKIDPGVFKFNYQTSNFAINSYMLKFEVYSDNLRIFESKEYFIVK